MLSLPLRFGTLFAFAAVALTATSASAQVVHWRIVKGPGFLQTVDDTPPAPSTSWSVCAFLGTQNVGDATSVTISGGGISGSLAFVLDGDEWVMEQDFPSQAAMNAVFPSGTQYTLVLSGGGLGTLTQLASFGPEQYPNTPFLTGTVFTDVQSVDPASPFPLTWSDPGPFTRASGVTVLQVFDLSDNDVFSEITGGATTAGTLPA